MLAPPVAYRKYRLARGWRIFMVVITPPLVVLFVGLPVHWALAKPLPLFTALYYLLPLGLAGLLLYGLAEALVGYVEIGPHAIAEQSVLGRRELAWVEIKGYRIGRSYLRLLPTDARKKPVKIGLLTEGLGGFAQWVGRHYPNLGPAIVAPAPAAPEAATTPGPAAQDQQRHEAWQTTRLLNRASWLVTAWLLLHPTPYSLAVMAGMLLPLGALAAQWLYPHALRPDEPDASPTPSPGVSLILPSIGLIGRVLLLDGAELVSLAAVQPWGYSVGAGFALLLLAGSRRHLFGQGGDFGQVIIILTAAALYGFGAPLAYNVAFDTGQPAYFTPRVVRTYLNTDEFAGYTAIVESWQTPPDSATVHVSRAQYQRLRPGHRVRVRQMPGALDIPWFRAVE